MLARRVVLSDSARKSVGNMILVLTIEKVRLPTTPTSRRNGPNVHLDRAGHLGVDAALILVVQRAA